VDVQQFLPRAAPGQVREAALAMIETLGAEGGYVMAPAHEMLDDIPPENIGAWVEAWRVYEAPTI
jgi:uroporphyrinogen decarboxylase